MSSEVIHRSMPSNFRSRPAHKPQEHLWTWHTFTNCTSVMARTLKSGTYWATGLWLSWLLLPPMDRESTLSAQLRDAERFKPLTWDGERNSEMHMKSISSCRGTSAYTHRHTQTQMKQFQWKYTLIQMWHNNSEIMSSMRGKAQQLTRSNKETHMTFEMNGKTIANDWMVVSGLCMSSISSVILENNRLYYTIRKYYISMWL